MKTPTPPRRWSKSAASPEARRARALFDSVRDPTPLSSEALERIEAGITARIARRGRLPSWVKAVVGAGALGAGGLAFAAVVATVAARGPAPGEAVTGAPLPADEVTVEDVAARDPRPMTPPQAGDLLRETRLMQQALGALRDEDDPRGALDALDQYLREFPSGQLLTEVRRVRLEALLELERHDAALEEISQLRQLLPEGQQAALELRVLEAAIWRDLGECRRAVAEVDRLLEADTLQGPLRQQARDLMEACGGAGGSAPRSGTP